MNKDTLVLYHANCTDGFGSALAAYMALGDWADYVPMTYDDTAPDVTGKRVFILDFSFKPDVLRRLDEQARCILLIDHHKAVVEELADFKFRNGELLLQLPKCGARMAWEYFLPGGTVPPLIDYIEDRDLWKWALPDSKAYLAALDAEEESFTRWSDLACMSQEAEDAFIERGAAMLEKSKAIVAGIAERALPMNLFGTQGLMVNGPQDLRNELGHELATKSGTFGLVWSQEKKDKVKVSLRSLRGVNVLPFAQQLGGGGHETACSFYLKLDRVPALMSGALS